MPHLVLTGQSYHAPVESETERLLPTAASPDRPRAITADRRTRVFFVTQPHTHAVGGIQRHSRRLLSAFGDRFRVTHVRSPLGGIVGRSAAEAWRARYRGERGVVYCDAAVSCLIGTRLRPIHRQPTVGTVHGLDITAPIPGYQGLIGSVLRRLSHVICVSEATRVEAIRHGVPERRTSVIPNAVDTPRLTDRSRTEVRRELSQVLGDNLTDKKILLSVGRPVKRKGFDRFAGLMFPHFGQEYVYIVAGPELDPPGWVRRGSAVLNARTRRDMLVSLGYYSSHNRLKTLSRHPRVYYLNGVSDSVRDLLYAAADVAVMPNRRIRGDMEGFGIVALEAAAHGVPVVAFGIEGIVDAIVDGQNGYTVPEDDFAALKACIEQLTSDESTRAALGRRAREFTLHTYSPERIAGQYIDLLATIAETTE